LQAGAGLCDETVVRSILGDAEDSINFLRKYDCHFDLGGDGQPH
jgi:aspartate oxidase